MTHLGRGMTGTNGLISALGLAIILGFATILGFGAVLGFGTALGISVPDAAAQGDDLTVVDAEVDGQDVTLVVVAPESIRGRVDTESFVIQLEDELVVPDVERIQGAELDVVLLVDTSGSMTEEAFDAALVSATEFIDSMPQGALVSVVGFGDVATVVHPFSTDKGAAIASLGDLVVEGNTALYAAIVEAARQFDPSSQSLRTLVLLSDGGNTVDESSLGSALAAVQATDAELHVVSIETAETDIAALNSLANASGGSVTSVGAVSEISAQYEALALDLNNRYRLQFDPETSGSVTATVLAWDGGRAVAETQVGLNLPAGLTVADQSDAPEVVHVEPEPARTVAVSAPGRLSFDAGANTLLKWGAIAALAAAIALGAALVLWPGGPTPKSAWSQFSTDEADLPTSMVASLSGGISRMSERLLGGERSSTLANMLDTAGWKVRNGEFLAIVGLITVVAFFGGALISPMFGLTAAVVWLALVGSLLVILVQRRRDAFGDQLNGTFLTMAGSLRAGYSLPQVFAFVAQEAATPTSDEFSRVVVETRLGRDLVEASSDVARRMDSEDFAWAAGAIEISRDLGGDLAEVLDNVATTIRARDQVRRQVKALSAEGRISAYILMVLPFPLFFWQLLVNRDYTMLLFNTSLGRTIFFGGVTALIVGGIWMRSLIKVEF